MQTNHPTSRHLSAPKQLARILGAVAGLAAMSTLLGTARAADGGQPGLNAPHQERNPSDRPELFTTVVKRSVSRSQGQAAAPRLPAGTPVRLAYVLTPSAEAPPVDDQPGTGAPHQERNPSQHPELWVQAAGR